MRCAPASPPTGRLLLLSFFLFLLLLPSGPAPARALAQPLPDDTEGAAIRGPACGPPAPASDADALELEPEPELAELRALRARLSRLVDAVDARARQRRRRGRAAASAPPVLLDCDGPACVARAVLRKAAYAARVARRGNRPGEDESGDGERKRARSGRPGAAASPAGRGGCGALPPPLLLMLLLLIPAIVVGCVAAVRCRRDCAGTGRRRRRRGSSPSLLLPVHEPAVPDQPWRRVRGCGFAGWQPEGMATPADEQRPGPVEKGGEPLRCGLDGREKAGGLQTESGGTEKRRCSDREAGDRYVDEPSVTRVAEHQDGMVVEEVGYVEEEDEYGDEDDDEELLLTLGDEIASFRSALELVEGMVAAQEERSRRV
ncbi:hypothetical protein VTH06DRAFT_1941 [Thermothelomyces fergusii]